LENFDIISAELDINNGEPMKTAYCRFNVKFNGEIYSYFLTSFFKNGKWHPDVSRHRREAHEEIKKCPFCHDLMVWKNCLHIDKHAEQVLDMLINHPSIRLLWVFQ
jgi:hypothetical protein